MFETDINLWAVLVATVVYFVIGGLWYSLLFAKQWMKLTGINEKEMGEGSHVSTYAATFVLLLILSYVLAQMLALAEVTTVAGGLMTGAWLWLGFIATTMAINAIYAGRPHRLTVIDAGYHLTGILAAASIITFWG